MNEKLANAIRWIKNHLDRVVVGFVVVMFLLQVLLFMQDRNQRPPDPPDLPPVALPELIEPEHAKLVESTYGEAKGDQQTQWIENLVKFNMFDIKQVRTREDIDREIAEKLREADRLYGQNKKEDALKIVDEILIMDRNVTKAIDLKAKIEAEIKPAPTPNP